METVDFKEEIQKVNEKITLLAEIKNIIKNECNQSIEVLESLHNRILELSSPEPDASNIDLLNLNQFEYRLCHRYSTRHQDDPSEQGHCGKRAEK
jgi:hypothetical protein